MICRYAECHYTECRIILIIMLNPIMPSVVMLNDVAPLWLAVAEKHRKKSFLTFKSKTCFSLFLFYNVIL